MESGYFAFTAKFSPSYDLRMIVYLIRYKRKMQMNQFALRSALKTDFITKNVDKGEGPRT